MNIQDAIKSKLRFRRKSWDDWVWVRPSGSFSQDLNASDVAADDWETSTVAETVTSDTLLTAYAAVMSSEARCKMPVDSDLVKEMAKVLGIA